MSDPTDQIPTLLTQVDNALHQLSPPIPKLVWGEGVVQSRQVLQQVRDYLLTVLQSSREMISDSAEQTPSASSERVTQQLSHLQREVEALQQERHRLIAEIQQLQTQSLSVTADYANTSRSGVISQATTEFVDLPQPHPEESWQSLDVSEGTIAKEPTLVNEDLSDIFGELELNEITSLAGLKGSPVVKADSHQGFDAAAHLDASEPPLDGQEYILASPHESLLPTDEDEDQIDSLLLVGRGTVQRLESELQNLEELISSEDDFSQPESEFEPDEEQSLEAVPSLEQLYAQFQQNLPQPRLLSDSTPSTFKELLDPAQENGIPFPRTAHPEAESFSLEALNQKFSQSRHHPHSQKSPQSED